MKNYIALKPRLSEKTYAISEKENTYAFVVPPQFNKHQIARAVAEQYEVEVNSVRIGHSPSKTKRRFKRGGRVIHKGQTGIIRKAYVTLKEGHKLPIFSAVEEASKEEAK